MGVGYTKGEIRANKHFRYLGSLRNSISEIGFTLWCCQRATRSTWAEIRFPKRFSLPSSFSSLFLFARRNLHDYTDRKYQNRILQYHSTLWKMFGNLIHNFGKLLCIYLLLRCVKYHQFYYCLMLTFSQSLNLFRIKFYFQLYLYYIIYIYIFFISIKRFYEEFGIYFNLILSEIWNCFEFR